MVLTYSSCLSLNAQSYDVKVVGRMSKIGKDFNLAPEILIDTIAAKNLYALGPVENLQGEIIVWDNKRYVATLTDDKKPMVNKNIKNLKAIFLVYSNVEKWDTLLIKVNVNSLVDLQNLVENEAIKYGIDTSKAFPFLIFGKANHGNGHIMFLDNLNQIPNAETIKFAKNSFSFKTIDLRLLGFYSKHQLDIFTHQNSFFHVHHLLSNRYQAGHLD